MFGELEDDQTALFCLPVPASHESREEKKTEKSAQGQGTSSAQRTPSVGPQ